MEEELILSTPEDVYREDLILSTPSYDFEEPYKATYGPYEFVYLGEEIRLDGKYRYNMFYARFVWIKSVSWEYS